MNERFCSQLLLYSNQSDSVIAGTSNTYNYLLWNNISFKTMLGDSYELGCKYNLSLKAITNAGGTSHTTSRAGGKLVQSNCMNFQDNRFVSGRMGKSNGAMFAFSIPSASSATYYRDTSICTFTLTGENGYILIEQYNGSTNFPNTTSGSEAMTFQFDIWKIGPNGY